MHKAADNYNMKCEQARVHRDNAAFNKAMPLIGRRLMLSYIPRSQLSTLSPL